jgi:hypothetical protein
MNKAFMYAFYDSLVGWDSDATMSDMFLMYMGWDGITGF